MREPKPYPELNAILHHLLDGARDVLSHNSVGTYLQGSFAVGDFTEWSDSDFIVVTARDLAAGEGSGLQALHAASTSCPAPTGERAWRAPTRPR